jgi:transcriptional regulator with XRE-family HTH domain
MNLGEYIRERRERLAMGQTELSVKSGLGVSTLSRLENGKSGDASKNTLRALATALDLPYEALFDLARGRPIKREDALPDVRIVTPQSEPVLAALTEIKGMLGKVQAAVEGNGEQIAILATGINRGQRGDSGRRSVRPSSPHKGQKPRI